MPIGCFVLGDREVVQWLNSTWGGITVISSLSASPSHHHRSDCWLLLNINHWRENCVYAYKMFYLHSQFYFGHMYRSGFLSVELICITILYISTGCVETIGSFFLYIYLLRRVVPTQTGSSSTFEKDTGRPSKLFTRCGEAPEVGRSEASGRVLSSNGNETSRTYLHGSC